MIRTRRLALTPITRDDAQRIAAGAPRDGWAEGYPTLGDHLMASMFMESVKAGVEPVDWQRMHIITLDGIAIGGIGVKGAVDPLGRVEIGYGLAPETWGQGIASEAVAGLCDWIFRNVPEVVAITAETDADNLASQKVLLNNGFTQEESGTWVLQA